MSVKSRLPKIRQASQRVVSDFANFQNKRRYSLRGSDPTTNYAVSIEWNKGTTFDVDYLVADCTCHKITAPDMVDCKGQTNGTVCYHSLASLTKAASNKGKTLVLFDEFSDAIRYHNLGGELIKITSAQGGGEAWGVVR